ncbi:MAG: hypothetical protein HDT28_01580 [Clostridiales bacterium]|nr:hypothetical protein [Clostridiales bacterium]
MNKTTRIKTIALIMLCVPFCGGWTAAASGQSDRYVGGEPIATCASETISYVSKQVVSDISTANDTPEYYSVNGMQNGCGPVAGAITIGFYDKYYDNLIPNWTPAYSTGRYKGQDKTYVPALIQDLYDSMQTNVVAPGVSENEFKSGLKSYVVDHGYNIEYISLGNGNSFNYSTFKTAVNNNEVSVLFVQSSNIYRCVSNEDEDVLYTINISGNHIMVAFGYYEVKYTLSNGIRTDKYLRVATGWADNAKAFYKVGSYIDAAYKVKVS